MRTALAEGATPERGPYESSRLDGVDRRLENDLEIAAKLGEGLGQ
jgi:hypothetical protein